MSSVPLLQPQLQQRAEELDALQEARGDSMPIFKSSGLSPEAETAQSQLREVLESAIEALPEAYRIIVVMREIEEMSVAETASMLDVSEAVVKTRLHRAHAMRRREIHSRARGRVSDLYAFHATRCDRVVKAVFDRIGKQSISGQVQ